MKKYLMYCSYIGRNYRGFQSQKTEPLLPDEKHKVANKDNSPGSIRNQKSILSKFNKDRTRLWSSGRTDAEVNAYRMPCCFILNRPEREEISEEKIKIAINYHLFNRGEDISVLDVRQVPLNFNPRRNIIYKEYIYRIEANLGGFGDYIQQKRKLVWNMKEQLDLEKFKLASQLFVGRRDFKHFTHPDIRNNATIRSGTVRVIDNIEVRTYDPEFREGKDIQALELSFQSKGFLQYQIRYMTNAIASVGLGLANLEDVQRLLDDAENIKTRDIQSVLRKKAPGHGLFLKDVRYKPEYLILK